MFENTKNNHFGHKKRGRNTQKKLAIDLRV